MLWDLIIYKVTSRIARWGRLLFLPFFGCSRSHLPVRNNLFFIFLVTGLFVSPIQSANAIQLNSDTQIATAGYFQLHWSGANSDASSDASKVLLLQESATPDFHSYSVIYEGMDLARVMSGKADGDYFYRVSADKNDSLVSNVVKVTVSHHPLNNAILFFIAGAIVFVSTCALIYKGSKKVDSR